MATKRPTKFDEVDWSEMETSPSALRGLSINSKLFLLTGIPTLLLAVYKWRWTDGDDLFVKLGEDLNLAWLFEMIGLTHNPEMLDLMFIFTLFLFLWYIILPLYQNARMTKYYWREFKRNRPAVVSLVWLLIVFAGGLIGPFFVPEPSFDVMTGRQPPVYMTIFEGNVATCVGEVVGDQCHGTWEHPLGTTGGGRDVFDSIVHGMTISMQIGFITTTIVAAIGISFGTVSAYSGGWIDEVLMRFVDVVLSFPTLPFYLLILYSFGASLAMFILVFALFAWGSTARYVRSKSLSISEEEFIKASRISGASTYRVIRRHVVPNTASSIITQLTLLIPAFLLAEAQIAFLGLGDGGVPSWGQLISQGRTDLEIAPWIVLAPGMALFLTILAFNFIGDALLDALNPEAEAEADR